MSKHGSHTVSLQSERYRKVYKYYRLSQDDENTVESNSITNQRQIVESHLATIPELANMPSVEAVDDGYTGTSFKRPGIAKVLDAARRGEVACIIVKDLSRFGRKYLEVSKYIEQLFPCLGVRFIAVGDGYDSDSHKGTTANLDVPVRNMLNALYSKNVSKTVKSAKLSQAQLGKYIHAFAPFGYMKDPANKHRIIVDEPAAKVVIRIFELICLGKTPKQIAHLLNFEGVPTPSEYKKKNGIKLNSVGITGSLWTYHSVNNLLRNEQYIGTFVAGKVGAGELGTGKRIYRPTSEWIRVENNHPAIITQEVWHTVMSKRGKYGIKRGKPNTSRMLFKRVRCGYCGHVMKYTANVGRSSYTCKTYRYTDEYGCTGTVYDEKEIVDIVKAAVKSKADIMVDIQRPYATSKNTIEEAGCRAEWLLALKRQLYERFKKGLLDKETYFKEREAVVNKIGEKTSERELSILNAGDEPSAEMVNALADAVYIYGKGRIEIRFSAADKCRNFAAN